MSIKEWLANYLWHLAKRGLPKAEDQHSLYLYHFLPLSNQILSYLKAEVEKMENPFEGYIDVVENIRMAKSQGFERFKGNFIKLLEEQACSLSSA